jgi:hypothetical protein
MKGRDGVQHVVNYQKVDDRFASFLCTLLTPILLMSVSCTRQLVLLLLCCQKTLGRRGANMTERFSYPADLVWLVFPCNTNPQWTTNRTWVTHTVAWPGNGVIARVNNGTLSV